MKSFDTGRDKVKKICDILKKETLEPAKEEAEKILSSARAEAAEIVVLARAEVETRKAEALAEIERERTIFQSSLGQACKQSLEQLREQIEHKILDQGLLSLLTQSLIQPHVLADLITAVIRAIEKEGTDVVLSAHIPATVPARAVNQLLAKEFLGKLKENGVLLGKLSGGIELVLHKDKITIDLSDTALKELVAYYIRKDFRTLIFGL